jgi:pilus assembly protein CpaC
MVKAISEGTRHARGSNCVRHMRRFMIAAVIVMGLMLAGRPVAAAKDRTVSVAINAGETYTIENIARDSTPGVKVLDNPHAMVVNSEAPGKIILVGAEPGSWDIAVTLANGEKVTYSVNVKSAASPKGPVDSSAVRAALGGSSRLAGGSTTPAAKPGDAGSGAVDAAADTGSGKGTGSAASGAADPASTASASATTASSGATEGGTSSGSAAVAASAPVGAEASAAPTAPSSAPAEPVRLASAAPIAPVATDASAGAPAPTAPKPVADTPVLAAAAAPAAVPSAAPTATGAPSSPNPGDSGSGMAPSQTVTAVQAPVEKFHTDPLAVVPPPLPPSGAKHFLPDEGVDLMVGTSEVIDFPTRIRRVSIADSKIADIQVINPYELNLVGHQTGFTTLAVWDTQGRYVERQVRVDAGGKQQVLLNVIVAELNRSNTEAFGINFSAALPRWNVSFVNMVGNVATPYNATSSLTANALISSNPPVTVATTAQGTLPPEGTIIPLLLSQNMTYGLAASNNNITTQSFFQFLETHQMAKILAEPHLLANSGEKAQFLSGGEIPIVIAQALNTSIVFKQFGTSVVFVPTVVGQDDIELKVKPEVSEPDYAHGVQLFGFSIPAFVTRRAETMVRLKNNQTLIIAGLLLNERNEQVNKVPYLGDIPWVRGLFRNTSYTNTKTDLVMTVTPQLVAPVPVNGQVVLPTDRGPLSDEEIQTRRVYPPDAARPRF